MDTDTFHEWLAEQMQSPEFRRAYAKYELAQQIVRLRVTRGLTQAQVAERVGTTQSSIARLESGSREPSLSFLRRVVSALGGRLEIQISADESVGNRPLAG
jgi:transcriptional regulator with XRE-family HTH domain